MQQSIVDLNENYFKLEAWKKWYISFVIENPNAARPSESGKNKLNLQESDKKKLELDVAIEVLNYRKQLIYFGGMLNQDFKHFHTYLKICY